MLNQYPLWKNLMVVFVLAIGLFYALPNVYSQDPAIAISGVRGAAVEQSVKDRINDALKKADIAPKEVEDKGSSLLIHFSSTTDQQKAQKVIAGVLPETVSYALTSAANVPDWLLGMGGKPMNLGLDLRGGIHVLIDVDMDAAIKDKVEAYTGDVRSTLRGKKIRYLTVKADSLGINIKFKDPATRDKAEEVLGNEFRNLGVEPLDVDGGYLVRLTLPPSEIRAIKKFALQQNITTIRNRVNALGVAEPLVQQQGERRIVVELPGVQDPTQVKNILGATATLEYRLVDTEHDALDAKNSGKVPPGSRLYTVREDGRPILLKKRVIVTGNQITDAASGFDQRSGSPMVTVNLDSKGARRMRNVTIDNVGKPMAVVFKENRVVSRDADGKPVKRLVEDVISVANILEPLGARFQTTGLDSPQEAHELALLLRAGALAAPIDIVEERTIGPSLGQENINQGLNSVLIGLLAVMVFMVVYYKIFGLFANAALLANLVLIVAILSLLQATLTLPGIAGIVLTVGMAVDANVLIYERIREELRVGSTPQAAIHAGYEKAFSTIMDANVTTLIAAIVLFSIGSGPVKGFAVTLAIGIVTSMFTSIVGTRALANLVYGGKSVKKLAI
ncbi:preprotein translocase subunit SecD [Thiolapillus brandeum]|uniref:Protein translocase subunit SecD n=1 Tax=Thiolapillus brandeum TaxID=1076588 RepID=A0A7U6GIA1_9GAMM|nr:preprotein translocase subunit SecD [Thiolapillus brandeum]